MKETVTNLNFYVRLDDVDEKALYTKLDVIIQFFKANGFHGNICVSFDKYKFEDEE